MDMNIEDPHIATALESLISEAGSTPVSSAKDRNKCPGDQKLHPSSIKSSRSGSETSTKFHLGPVSGSVISLTDSIRNNRYSASNAGPFDVHVQHLSDSKSSLHPIFERIICELIIEDILEIKRIGYSKVSVFFKSREAANALVEDRRLATKDVVAFIPPPFRISRKDIIRDVPLDLIDQMILRNINSPIKVVAVNRLNRRITRTPNIDSQEDAATPITYTPSLIVSLIFEDQKIPNYIVMFHVRYPVSPYIARVSRCNQCFRFGHIKVNCKSQPRCAYCEGKGHTFSKEQCQHSEDPPKCANCKGDHRVDSPSCPELITQKEIRNDVFETDRRFRFGVDRILAHDIGRQAL
ncbi:uncharacterized protein LOC115245858 isoform X2 [Formica exsecta]|uniref:uncharacterized protein LOC115245858 isoform X2 n=1 Tax=Formica exsecta TaxID=72781 RepID=UPI001141447D|nr:uncharacterized protein LOC115245858 isoform X2 [Formica exsecta]